MNLFAYGTLVFPAVMEAVTGRTLPAAQALLRGFERFGLRERSYPGIAERAGACAPGVLYASLDARDLAFLDLFEDDFYERREVEVERADGTRARAFAYVIPAAHASHLAAGPWSPERFERDELPAYVEHCRRFHARARTRVDASAGGAAPTSAGGAGAR